MWVMEEDVVRGTDVGVSGGRMEQKKVWSESGA